MRNIYDYLVENGLLEEFLMNFKVTRKIREMNRVKFVGDSYYLDGVDKIPLQVYRYQYDVKNIYTIFGCEYVTSDIVCGNSVKNEDIPFKKKGKYDTSYCDLSGYEHATYYLDGRKNIMSKYGKSGVLDLPCEFRDLFNDKDFNLFVYLFYTYIKDRENIDIDDVYSLKRLIQVTNEMNKLRKERDQILKSFDVDILKKKC